MNTAIEMTDYSFRYDGSDKDLLLHCSMELHYGEFMVLSGPSGEGKSTLLSLINGVIPNIIPGCSKGQLLIDGISVADKSIPEISRYVGSVLQNADSQIVHDLVDDEIAFGCENLEIAEAEISRRIDASCQFMELRPDWHTRTLSGGQKQRLTTASTLAMNQKILVFDEPLANLDLEGAQILLRTLKDLTAQGYAVLFVEHRLDMVLPYADRVLWLEKGQLSELEQKQQALKNSMNLIADTCTSRSGSDAAAILDIQDLCFSYHTDPVLRGFSLSVKKGERIVILGENGCGKSTLLRLIARFLKPASGTIHQNLLPGSKKPSAEWFRKTGYVYQNPNYQLFMSQVSDEIAYSSQEEDAAYCMKEFQLDEIAATHPHALSEGQKRRVGIAAIAAAMPRLFLLDEPTTGQDYEHLRQIVNTLNQIHEKTGNTMITITHDYRCAAAMADRIIWMADGTIYRQGGKELADEYFMRHIN